MHHPGPFEDLFGGVMDLWSERVTCFAGRSPVQSRDHYPVPIRHVGCHLPMSVSGYRVVARAGIRHHRPSRELYSGIAAGRNDWRLFVCLPSGGAAPWTLAREVSSRRSIGSEWDAGGASCSALILAPTAIRWLQQVAIHEVGTF